jgi:tetratricopeptide (TPR) repeat protein
MKYLVTILLIITVFISSCGSGNEEQDNSALSDRELLELAAMEYNEDNYTESLLVYNEIKAKYPNTDYYLEVNIGKARTLNRLELYEEANELILQTLKENIMPQQVPRIYTEIGHFYRDFAKYDPGRDGSTAADNYAKALNFYSKALDYDESNDRVTKSEAYASIGMIHALQGQFDEAADQYQRFMDKYPDSPYLPDIAQRLSNPQDTTPFKLLPLPEDRLQFSNPDTTGQRRLRPAPGTQEVLETEL